MIIKSFVYDSFIEGLLWLPARILVGPPFVLMLVLFADMSWLGMRCPGIKDDAGLWAVTLPLRLLVFAPVVAPVSLMIGRLHVGKPIPKKPHRLWR